MFRDVSRNNRLVMLALFIWGLGEGLWYYNFRQIYLTQLGATELQVGMALAIESVVRALLPIPAGYLSDRIGARHVMVFSWVVGIAGPLIGALAHTWQAFIPALAVYAMSAFSVPAISAYALENLPASAGNGSRDRVLTTIYAVYPLGLIVSPALGGVLADAYGIRTLLWISVAVFVISTAVVMLTGIPEIVHHSSNESARDLLRNRRFMQLMGYFMLVFAVTYLGYQLLPNFMQEVRGLSLTRIGLLFSIGSAGTALINLAAGRIHPRWNFPAVLAVYGLAMAGLWLSAAPPVVMVAFFATGAIMVTRTLATARAAEVVSARNRGLAFGIIETALSIALAVSAWGAGGLYALTAGHDLPLVVSLAATPLMIGMWFMIRNRMPAPVRDDRQLVASDVSLD